MGKRAHCTRGSSGSSRLVPLHSRVLLQPVRKLNQLPGRQARSVPPISQPGTQRSLRTETWLAGPRSRPPPGPPPAQTSVTHTSPLPTCFLPGPPTGLHLEPAVPSEPRVRATCPISRSSAGNLSSCCFVCAWWSLTPWGRGGALSSGLTVGFIHPPGVPSEELPLCKSGGAGSWPREKYSRILFYARLHFSHHSPFRRGPAQDPLIV